MALTLTVNGKAQRIESDPSTPLLVALRDELGLTGAKYGCGEGQCGACTVLLDGRAVRSCTIPVRMAAGKSVTTIEGLSSGDNLHPVQQAFLEKDALQCGYCTPGMILSAVALLKTTPNPAEPVIKRGMQGNICRCGTYPRIVAAVRLASTRMAGGGAK